MASERLTLDNRNQDDMLGYLEARVEALAHRVQELERENTLLRREQLDWRLSHESQMETIR